MLHNSFITEVPIYRNQSILLQSKSVDWFQYDRDLRHEGVTYLLQFSFISIYKSGNIKLKVH